MSLKFQSSSGGGRSIRENWVDAIMGYMKGVEDCYRRRWGHERQIIREDLRKTMVEMCPRRVDEDGIEDVAKKTTTARTWIGWPVFDVNICKFGVEQWLVACDIKVNRDLDYEKRLEADTEVEDAELEIERILWTGKEETGSSTQDSEISERLIKEPRWSSKN